MRIWLACFARRPGRSSWSTIRGPSRRRGASCRLHCLPAGARMRGARDGRRVGVAAEWHRTSGCSSPPAVPGLPSRIPRRCCSWYRARWCWESSRAGNRGWPEGVAAHRLQCSAAAHVRRRGFGDVLADPWVSRADRRPLLPADVQKAFADSPHAAWITTPLHMRSLVQAGMSLHNCAVVIASTMPLTQPLAQQAQDLTGASVLEIYGSTETGVIAMRRSASDADWLAVRDVRIEPAIDAAFAFGSISRRRRNFPTARTAQRPIRASRPPGRYRQDRRSTRVIGGAESAPPATPRSGRWRVLHARHRQPQRAPVLIHAGPALDRAATERWFRSRMDPVFLPRTFIRVDSMPRSESGKLRRQAMDPLYATWRAATRDRGSASRR